MPSDKDNNYIMCPGHIRPIMGLAFSKETPDGVFLVSACQDKVAMIRDGNTGDWIGSLLGHKGAVSCCSINSEGTLVATGSNDFTCKIWNGITGECIYTLEDKHIIKSVSLSNLNTYVAYSGRSNILNIYSLKDSSKPYYQLDFITIDKNKQEGILKCVFSTLQDTILYVLHSNGILYVFDIEKKIITKQININKIIFMHIHQQYDENLFNNYHFSLKDICISQDNSIICICINEYVCFFDSNLELSFIYHFDYVPESISINSNNTRFLLTNSTIIYEYTLENGQEYHIYKGHSGNVRSTAYHPNTVVFASGSEDGCLRLWNHL